MRNIFILNTDKPSRLHVTEVQHGNYDHLNPEFNSHKVKFLLYPKHKGSGKRIFARNIYITSDENIVFNDFITDGYNIWQWKDDSSLLGRKKIILTTDEDLIAKGVQPIDEEFLQWFVKNPTCTKVEVDVVIVRPHYSYPRDGINHYNIIMPKEPKTFAELFANTHINPTTDANGNTHYYFKAIKKEDNDVPVINSKWRHYNGNIYTVIELTNLHSENFDKYPITVVYKGENGKIWSRPLSDWSRSFTKFKETDNYPTNQWDIKEIEALKAYTENREQVFWKNHSIKRTGKKSEQLCRYCSSTTNWCDDFNAKTCENYLKSSDSIIKKAAEKYAIEEWEDLYNHVGLTGAERGWETITDFIAGAKSDAAKNYWFEQFEVYLRKAYEAGGKMSWTDGRQESQEPYYYDFEEWLTEFKQNSQE